MKRKALVRVVQAFASDATIADHARRERAQDGDAESQETISQEQHLLRWWNRDKGNVIGEIGAEERRQLTIHKGERG